MGGAIAIHTLQDLLTIVLAASILAKILCLWDVHVNHIADILVFP